MMSSDQSIDDIEEDIEQADDDVTRTQRWWAYAQLALLFGGTLAGVVAAVAFGFVDPQISVQATINIGTYIEYLFVGFAALFLLYVLALVLIALPGSILSLLGGLAFGIAKAGGYLDDGDGGDD